MVEGVGPRAASGCPGGVKVFLWGGAEPRTLPVGYHRLCRWHRYGQGPRIRAGEQSSRHSPCAVRSPPKSVALGGLRHTEHAYYFGVGFGGFRHTECA